MSFSRFLVERCFGEVNFFFWNIFNIFICWLIHVQNVGMVTAASMTWTKSIDRIFRNLLGKSKLLSLRVADKMLFLINFSFHFKVQSECDASLPSSTKKTTNIAFSYNTQKSVEKRFSSMTSQIQEDLRHGMYFVLPWVMIKFHYFNFIDRINESTVFNTFFKISNMYS